LELRSEHVGLSAAWGVSSVGINLLDGKPTRNIDLMPALALRIFSGDGKGLVGALNWAGHSYERNYDDPCCYDRTARLDTFTAALGWRFRWSTGWYVEVAAGAGVAITSGHPSVLGNDSTPGPYRRDTQITPDIVLGTGFEF
jgi:hypothetical protein